MAIQLDCFVGPRGGPPRNDILKVRIQRSARGFTLIELLLAMALLTMLVTALLTFVFNMGDIWGRGGDKRLFEQHQIGRVPRTLSIARAHIPPIDQKQRNEML